MQSCPFPDRCAHLFQSEADYNRLFSLSLDLLCIAGLDGYFKRVNPSWTRVLGWTEAELLERPVEFFMHPEDRERTLQARAGLARGVPVCGLENRYRCKDGSYRWLSWQSITEPSGTTVFAVARDITERRQLDQEQLILSKLESTGVLAAGIAHDFNNLLAGLTLTIECIALAGETNAEQAEHLRRARQTLVAAQALTNQLITFADGGVPARQIVDLGGLIRESLDHALRGSSLKGECVVAPGLWPAEVDEGQLGQVLRNLVLNAREATPAGGTVRVMADNVVLAAAAGRDGVAGDFVRVTIEDDGPGIPANILPKIFDPYFSTKQRGSQKGMGLGLTICRTVVKKHGGAIAIESRPGTGTKVTVHLPARRTAAAASPAPPAAGTAGAPRILVMDDEAMLREALAGMLPRLGYAVEVAGDGDEAIALYERAAQERRPFALVLLDLTVRGGRGGIDTLPVLREKDPGVKAVLMTGYAHGEAFQRHTDLGFLAALAKPFPLAKLRALLAELIPAAPAGLAGARLRAAESSGSEPGRPVPREDAR